MERPPGIVGPDGLADVVPTAKGRFPPSAESLCTLPDRFGQFRKWHLAIFQQNSGPAAEVEPGARRAIDGPLDSASAKAQTVGRPKR